MTYFEALTALAYLWFADKPVGLGRVRGGHGRDVGRDEPRRRRRRRDLPDRARPSRSSAPRSPRWRPRRPASSRRARWRSSASSSPEASAVIQERATAVGAELKHEFEDFEVDRRLLAVGGQSLAVRGLYTSYDDLFVPLFGEHAARNAAAAIAALEALLGQAAEHRGRPRGPRRPHLARPARGRRAASRWSSSTGRTTPPAPRRWPSRCASSSRGTGCTWCWRSAPTRTSTGCSGRWRRSPTSRTRARNAQRPQRRGRGRSRSGSAPRASPSSCSTA